MGHENLKTRTRLFALRVIGLVEQLPRSRVADVLGRQLLRSATSVGANYRAACRARSRAEFIAKMGIVEEEVDESVYWMELLLEAEIGPKHETEALLEEADQLLAITVSSVRTARRNKNSTKQ